MNINDLLNTKIEKKNKNLNFSKEKNPDRYLNINWIDVSKVL